MNKNQYRSYSKVYNAYFLPDIKSVLYHPDVGMADLHLCRMGKIVIPCSGVSLRKVPDQVYDRTGMNVVYTLPATVITEQQGQKTSCAAVRGRI